MKANAKQPLTSEVLDAMPPCELEAERAVIASLVAVPAMADDVMLVISPEDFYSEANAVIFGHLQVMHAEGRKIDLTLLHKRLRSKAEDFERIGGGVYLGELLGAQVVAANAVHYAQLVRDAAIRRELIHAGAEIIRTAHAESEAGEALDQCERGILTIRDKRGTLTSQASDVATILQDLMLEIDSRSSERPPWLPCGFPDLDRMMGFRKSELTVLAARPSMGKSALAMDIAANVAEQGEPAMFFSLEMSSAALAERLLCAWAEVDANRLRRAMIDDSDRRKLVEASAALSQIPLVIDDTPNQNMQRIAATCRRQKRRKGLALVVIDYLQLIEPDNAKEPRQEQVAKVSRRLKGLARELEVPVLCLAQLNREVDKRTDPRPRLSDLRESGAIEQDADVVAFVHRGEYYYPDKPELKGKAEVLVRKVRNGPTGDVQLCWMAQYASFRNLAVRDMDNYQRGFDEWNEGQ
jgi:replicative DNA helicase